MKMIFLQSKARIRVVAFSLMASVQAAYHMTTRSTRPTLSLQRMIYPSYNRPSFFERDLAQVMRGFDQMFDSMAMMNRFDDMFYQPFPLVTRQLQLMNRQSIPDVLRVPYEIAQDDKQAQIKISLPGIEASDINLQVDQDKHLLTITGKSKHQENGFQSTTSFERSFTLTPDIDASNISAQLQNDVLLITAPKLDSPKETVRKIDVVDLGKRDDESHKATAQKLPTEEAKAEAEEAVTDLDVQE